MERLENHIKQMKESCKLIVRFLETKSYLYIQLKQFLQLITRVRILSIVNMQSLGMTDSYGTAYLCLMFFVYSYLFVPRFRTYLRCAKLLSAIKPLRERV